VINFIDFILDVNSIHVVSRNTSGFFEFIVVKRRSFEWNNVATLSINKVV